MSLLVGCGVPLSGLGGSLFSPFSLLVVSVLFTVAAFLTLIPSRKGCNGMETVVTGDQHRYRKDTNKLRNSQVVDVFFDECVFHETGSFLPGRLRGRCCTLSTDVPALVGHSGRARRGHSPL